MHIQTTRLELKPITAEALDNLMDLLTDDVVKQTYMLPDFQRREDALPLAQRLKTLSEGEAPIVVGIFAQGQLVGMMNETERKEAKIEMGYALLPKFHNRGYATEALTAVIPWLFAQGFREVIAGAFEGNDASLRVMAKSGMQKLAYTDEVEYRGKMHPCIYYGAFAKEQ